MLASPACAVRRRIPCNDSEKLARLPATRTMRGGLMIIRSPKPCVAALLLMSSAASAQQLAPSPTLDAVKARGHVECGVHLGLPGFSFANDKGEWSGLDVDFCKAVAAAVLGDAAKVKFTPTSVQQRWPILQSGQVDLLSRNTTIT